MKTISVIIPVYNTFAYLDECLQSIVNQINGNTEIVLVNDGSTDNSLLKCEEYSKKYDFIKVINKTNGGLSDARNVGIQNASGDYILFIDSDDYIAPNALSIIHEKINHSDIDVFFLNATKFYKSEFIQMNDGYNLIKDFSENKETILNSLGKINKFPASACTKCIKRNLIITNNLFFEKNLLHEDISWTLSLLLKAETFDYIDCEYYFYRQNRSDSITSNVKEKNFDHLSKQIEQWCDTAQNLNISTKSFIYSALAFEYIILIYFYSCFDKDIRKKYLKQLAKYKWLLKKYQYKSHKSFSIFVKLFGLKISTFVLKTYRNFKQKTNRKGS